MRLVDYWPPHIQEIQDFVEVAKAEQPELDKLLQAVKLAPNDFFLSTLAEYGIVRWERILGIEPDGGLTLAERREQIQILYASQLPYTYRALLAYLRGINQAISASVVFYNYLLLVEVPHGSGQIDLLRRVLREMVPANMVVDVASAAPMEIHAGAALAVDYGYFRF